MPSYTPQTDVWAPYAAGVCNSCGAWVSGQDEDKHNKFHEALAKLFADVRSSQGKTNPQNPEEK